MDITDINLDPISGPDELAYLSGLSQFHRIENKMLFKLVRVATGFTVRERFIAIRIILAKRVPIPVPEPLCGKQ